MGIDKLILLCYFCRMDTTIGKRIRQLRTEAGITQVQLAALVGCNQATVSYIETAPNAQPSEALLRKLCDVLKTSPNALYGYEQPSAATPPLKE